MPLFGKDASRAASRAEALQDVLGEHQDSVRSQDALRQLGVTAHLSGENGFSFGLLLGAERQRAAAADAAHGEAYDAPRRRRPAARWTGLSSAGPGAGDLPGGGVEPVPQVHAWRWRA